MNNSNFSKIEFTVKDFFPKEMNYIKKQINSIAFDVYENPQLLSILRDFLFVFTDHMYPESKISEWKSLIKSFECMYKKDTLKNFCDKLDKSYRSIKPQDIDKFRGLLFEVLLEIHYRELNKLYEFQFESGCKITIDGEDIIYIDDNKKRETVDIATYNIDKSLFYELKVGPTSFDYHVIEYLKLLNRKICEKNISKVKDVGCLTLKPRRSLISHLKKNNVNHENLQIFGFSEVFEILNKKNEY